MEITNRIKFIGTHMRVNGEIIIWIAQGMIGIIRKKVAVSLEKANVYRLKSNAFINEHKDKQFIPGRL